MLDEQVTATVWPQGSDADAPTTAVKNSRKSPFQVGDCLNNCYEIRKVLGAGGMGQVFEAYDRSLKRKVAIKASWTEEGVEALEGEAMALAALAGRGVPAVYGLMTSEQGVRYYVMERVLGKTLASYLRTRLVHGPLPLADAVRILIGIADTLSGLHGLGLIHCDLKPANIMMAPDDQIVLLDLGLFLSKGQTGNQAEGIMLRGSPRYIAPERITSSVGLNDVHLLDIYSLGIIGFLLLTGQHPFDGDSVHRLVLQHLHRPAPLVSRLRQDVPRQLERLIADMMSKDPSQRPATAADVAAELKNMRATGALARQKNARGLARGSSTRLLRH